MEINSHRYHSTTLVNYLFVNIEANGHQMSFETPRAEVVTGFRWSVDCIGQFVYYLLLGHVMNMLIMKMYYSR